MTKTELKQIIKPMVAQCIKESLLEEGILSTVISEVVKGMSAQLMVESPAVATPPPQEREQPSAISHKLEETKKQMMAAIGNDAYGGVNLFEGTRPAPADAQQNAHGPLKDTDPNDSGVDITGLFNSNWSKLV